MTKRLLPLLISAIFTLTAWAQDSTVIEQVEISGVREERLSQALRDEMQRLVGQSYDPQVANQFADRIQSELPEFVAASRIMPGTDSTRIRLIFAVARISDRDPLGENVNARYTVESVEVDGFDQSTLSESMNADMKGMVGRPLDNDEAERLEQRLTLELPRRHQVYRRVERGSTRQYVRVVYVITKLPLVPFRKPPSFVSYHQKLGTSFALNPSVPGIGPRGRNAPVRFIFGAANSADDLIERYKGFRLGFEHVNVGTEHLGFKLDYTAYGTRWQNATEVASQSAMQSPGLYRSRHTLEPSVAVALTEELYFTAGVSVADLEMQSPDIGSQSASAGVGSVRYRRSFGAPANHDVEAGFEIRAGSHTLDSDYIYTRHLLDGGYGYRRGNSRVRVNILAGRITGSAPLFDRFSLGNTQTLRGWNKFDLAPLGANRMVYGSIEYTYRELKVFYDTGSVWNREQAVKVRSSVGVGVGDNELFFMFGLRIDAAQLKPAFMISSRFGF